MKLKLKLLFMLVAMILITHGNGFSIETPITSTKSAKIDSRSYDDIYNILVNMNIPLIEITTVDGEEPTCEVIQPPAGAWGSGITNATKVPASMKIIKNGETLYDSGDYVNKESGLTIKIRGNTSGNKPKKPYKLKLQKKADLLFRGDKKYKDKDWVLLRTGASLVTPIGYWTSELIGQEWTPAHQIVNVWMNGTYRGLYILCEQVTINPDCRIAIDENEGYVVECDAYWWTEDICFPSTLAVPQLKFTYKYPDPEDITDDMHEAISSDVIDHEAKISDGTYDEYYDCESFAKWLVGWDLLGNGDGAGANMYIVKKDASSKIAMGPMWDFDQSLKISDDWIVLHYDYFYFHHLLQSSNDSFRKAFKQVWKEKGRMVAESLIERINAFADSQAGIDYQKSLDLQEDCKIPVDFWQPYVGDLEFMREYATDFIAKRADWIDSHIDDISGVEVVNQYGPVDDREQTFDILGRPVAPNTTGILIRNGKKVVIMP